MEDKHWELPAELLKAMEGLSALQLAELQKYAGEELASRRATEGPLLVSEFERRAAALGLDVRELVLRQGAKKRGRGRPSKNGSGANHAQQ